MTRSSSFRTLAPIWVGVSALAVIAWAFATRIPVERAQPDPEPEVRACSLPAPAEPSDVEVRQAITPEPSWESQHPTIPVKLDPELGQRGTFRGAARPEPSEHSKPFCIVTLLEGERLSVVSGLGNGFSGKRTEMRFSARSDGGVECHAAASMFSDSGPFFDDFWADLTGNVTISAASWKRGDVLYIAYEVCGVLDGQSIVDSGRLRVEVP